MGLNRLKPRAAGESSGLRCSCSFFFRERYVLLPFSSRSSSDEAPDGGERRLELLEIISLMISGRDSKKGTLVATAAAVEDGGGDAGGGGLAAEAALAMAMAAAAPWNEESLAAAATASDCWRLAR